VIIEIAEGVKARVLKSSIATKHDSVAETTSENSSTEPVKDTGSKEDE